MDILPHGIVIGVHWIHVAVDAGRHSVGFRPRVVGVHAVAVVPVGVWLVPHPRSVAHLFIFN